MSVKKKNEAGIKAVLGKFGTVRKDGSTLANGEVEGLKVITYKPLTGAHIRDLAEMTETYPNQLSIERSGKGLRISVT